MKRLTSPEKLASVRTTFPRPQINFGLFGEPQPLRKTGVPNHPELEPHYGLAIGDGNTAHRRCRLRLKLS